ncbi:hypothetical protein V8G54_001446 [Vigna mungo]|uniref:Uncharacterized protein n=1 Tax=Vigna mungo TaxID=3915 RepID=A0AAQ3P8Q7_VIGMU
MIITVKARLLKVLRKMEDKVLCDGDWWWHNSQFCELGISLLFGFLFWFSSLFPLQVHSKMKEEEQTWFEASRKEDEYGCYEKRFEDCPSTISVRTLRVNEGFTMVAQRRRHHGVRRVPTKMKLAMALVAALGSVAASDGGLQERLATTACAGTKLKENVVVVVEEEKVVKG